MKLYVMSAFSYRETTQRFIDDAVAVGHQITLDWTRAEGQKKDDEMTFHESRRHALADMNDGVSPAELCVFLAKDPKGCGALIEFGMAAAEGKEIWVVEPWRFSIFWCLPGIKIVESEYKAREMLGMQLPKLEAAA